MAHIAKKGNRYFVVVYGGINRATGEGIRDWSDGFATRKEAEREAVEIEKRKHEGSYRSPDRITLADYLNDRWLPLKKSQLSRSTFDSYRNSVRLHVEPRIGSIQLRQLQPEDLDTFYAEQLVDGSVSVERSNEQFDVSPGRQIGTLNVVCHPDTLPAGGADHA